MYNKKSKVSAILTIVTALLLVGLMILLPILLNHSELEGWEVLALIFGLIYGFLPLYVGSFIYVIVAFILGGKMRKEQDRDKLISFNKRMLIAGLVLLPFIALGTYLCSAVIAASALGVIPVIYVVITAIAYVATIVANIVAMSALKKMADEYDDGAEDNLIM